jgi:D-alanyl-D-alanine carboxypeptidase/D-alanyl-D-alanine-endopeptidase (penicillin-binding protein 4)
MTTGQSLYEYNADSLLSTASCMKLVTTAAALDRWGKNRFFKTAFFIQDSVVDSVIYGPLFVKGYGDPYFTTEIMLKTVYHFHTMGIREIKGSIIADDSYLQDTPNSEKNDRAYAALGNALSFNFNTVTICVRPGTVGDTAKVFTEPASDLFRIVNRTLTVDSGSGVTIDHNNVSMSFGKDVITIYVGGTIASDELEYTIYKRVNNPPIYAATVLKETFRKMGIRITGDVKQGYVPRKSKLFHETYSYDLGYIISGINKWSNNQAAGQLCMIMGAEEYGVPGTDEKGIIAMKPFLTKAGIDSGDIIMVDGSGLDGRNKMTPRAHVRLLNYMYHRFQVSPEFVSSLSIGGVDGTERKRFKKNGGPVNRSRLKIGYLWGISGLSGYIETRRGDVIAFCMLTNDFPKDYYDTIKRIEDQVCAILGNF